MEDLVARLKVWDGPQDDEALQSMVFAVGKEHGFEPLRDWFKALYEVLLGASRRAALWRVHRALRGRGNRGADGAGAEGRAGFSGGSRRLRHLTRLGTKVPGRVQRAFVSRISGRTSSRGP